MLLILIITDALTTRGCKWSWKLEGNPEVTKLQLPLEKEENEWRYRNVAGIKDMYETSSLLKRKTWNIL